MTKAQQILTLYASRDNGLTPRWKLPKLIARLVGTTPAYVRTVARQRKGRGQSEHDKRYITSPLGKAERRRLWEAIKANPQRHEANKAYRRVNYRREREAEASP